MRYQKKSPRGAARAEQIQFTLIITPACYDFKLCFANAQLQRRQLKIIRRNNANR
ncbi:hypothetical protein SMSP1_00514 [Sedimentisphaera salicampi]|nr:hypothetical protein SMSP1_00514 [Sedimentisphaera salicampi]